MVELLFTSNFGIIVCFFGGGGVREVVFVLQWDRIEWLLLNMIFGKIRRNEMLFILSFDDNV